MIATTTRIALPLLLAAFALSGCVDREQADAKLARACAAGVGALLPEGSRIDSVKSHRGEASPEGGGMRHIVINAVYIDGWIEQENEYDCTFEENFGLFGTGYEAAIYQVRTGDKIIGKAGGDILGEAQDFIKLTDAVREALYGNP